MKLSRDTQNKLNTVTEIIKYLNYVGTATADNITKVVFKSESQAYKEVKIIPLLDALVLTGQLNKCVTKVNCFYSIAK